MIEVHFVVICRKPVQALQFLFELLPSLVHTRTEQYHRSLELDWWTATEILCFVQLITSDHPCFGVSGFYVLSL